MQQYLPWFIATAALAVLGTLSVLWLLQALRRPAGPPPLPVEWDLLPRPVFTADERRVYRQLRDALPHHIVLAKLPMVRFCQPADPKAVRYWFDLLGANHVTFAVCSANGRVLAAIDLSYDRGGPPGRSTRIKQAVLAACRVRYLRCPADHLPSIPELQLLVPMGSNASRGPQPAQASASMSGGSAGLGSNSRRRERSALWQDSMSFHDSFFSSGSRRELDTGMGDLTDTPGSTAGDAEADMAPAGMVVDDPAPPGRSPSSTDAGAPPAGGGHPFDHLTPQGVLDALDAAGQRGDGRLLQLNSYENRVFQVMLEDGGAVVAKFYRPGRWTDDQIAEEHAFAAELALAEVPVVAPLPLDGAGPGVHTLGHARIDGQPFRLAVYPRRAGHGPELDQPDTLRWLGRFIGRMHAVGAQRPFTHRRRLDAHTFGHAPLARLLALDVIDPAQHGGWLAACRQALTLVDAAWAAVPFTPLRLHGDCHPGNILWRDVPAHPGDAGGPHIVDLDDAVAGPAVQDLWMLLSGDAPSMRSQLDAVLEGYQQFHRFDRRELALIEPLRTLRMLHHSVWLAERWTDPAFPLAFPWFGTPNYWSQQTVQLREQIEAMTAPPPDLDFTG